MKRTAKKIIKWNEHFFFWLQQATALNWAKEFATDIVEKAAKSAVRKLNKRALVSRSLDPSANGWHRANGGKRARALARVQKIMCHSPSTASAAGPPKGKSAKINADERV